MRSTKLVRSIAAVITGIFSFVISVYADYSGDFYDDSSYLESLANIGKDQEKIKIEKDNEALRGRWVYRYANIDSGFYVGGSAGLSLSAIGESQRFTSYDALGNEWIYNYRKDKNYSKVFLFGFNGGYEFALNDQFLLDLGAAIYVGPNYAANGKVDLTFYEDTQIGLESYSYDVTRMVQAMFESKLKWKILNFLPYITVGIGSSWNKAECYSAQTATNMTTTVFNPNSKVNFAYLLGFGVDYQFSNNDYIGVSYKYINLGKINFGVKDNLPQTLSVGTIATHNITLNLTHRF